jgi:hypothetical protein
MLGDRLRATLLAALLVLPITLSVGIDAHAEPSVAEVERARKAFAEGLALEKQGKWAPALERFRDAAAVRESPQIAFHLGVCLENLGRFVEAIAKFRAAAAAATTPALEEVERIASARAAALEGRVAKATIATDPSAVVFVDGVELQDSGARSGRHAVRLDPGVHRFEVRLDGRSQIVERTFADGEEAEFAIPIAARPRAPVPASAPIVPPVRDTPKDASAVRTASWIALGVGGAAIAGGLFALGVSRERLATFDSRCPSRTDCDPVHRETYDAGRSAHVIGVVLGASGLALASAGIVGLAITPKNGPQVAVSATPGGLLVQGRF